MIRLLKNDDRSAVGFLNYPRPVQVSPFTPMGPNTLDEVVWPVEISEDGKRVGFSFISPVADGDL